MTSSILAQKLMAISLDHAKLENIKNLRENSQIYLHNSVVLLESIKKAQPKEKVCRLCLTTDEQNKYVYEHSDIVKNTKILLDIEIRIGDGKPHYICNSCENILTAAAKLKETAEFSEWHLQQELDMVSNICDKEGVKQDTEKIILHGGYFTYQGDNIVREWSCQKCKVIFKTREEFFTHCKLLSCDKPQSCVCEICGINVKISSRLNTHRLVHTSKFLFKCVQCPYRSYSKYGLAAHERSHSGVRPFSCRHCPASFATASNLNTHSRTHQPPRYHCHICDKKFTLPKSLRNHIATQHSKVRAFNCSFCEKTFYTMTLKNRHEIKIHNRPRMRSGVTPTYLRHQNSTLESN